MKKIAFLAAASFVSIIAGSQSALADCDCGSIRNIVNDGVNRVNDHTTDVGNDIANTILQGVAQLSAYSKRATEAQKRITEAAQVNDVTRQKQIARGIAESGRYDPASSACVDLSGIFSIGKAGGGQGLSGKDITNASRNWSYGNEDIGAPVAQGGLAVANAIITDRDRFKGVGGFADPTSDARLITDAITLDTTKKKIAGAHIRLVNNIVDPIPAKPITEAESKTPAGRAQIAAREVDASRRSAAHAIMSYIGDLATPTGSSELAAWAKKAAPQGYPYQIGDQVSQLQAMDIFVRSRFPNAKWHEQLARMSPDAVQREQLLATALTQQIEWMRFDLERRNAIALAAVLSTILDNRDTHTTNIPMEAGSGT
ncbi:hypothetical protein [Brucella anthropi]|uniref:hypothetical protein n=1 Tax=Brucella anthropi TaxID=529 RepID=UPI0004ED7D3A|nr:hypothetical protein [Brucella anthropi]AIK40877.1 hypothetical protein DR92_4416 [Brucella anthropi]KAB2747437.1 hypothetical protein F9K95_21060 [Brucella anthropi]